jgi:primosomal protein N' (replication factor Y)
MNQNLDLNSPAFCDLVVPGVYRGGKQTLTYVIPERLIPNLKLGQLVLVELKNRKVIALVARIHNRQPHYKLKEVIKITVSEPVVADWQLAIMQRVADYYFTSLWSVAKLFIPPRIWEGKWTPPRLELVHLVHACPLVEVKNVFLVTENISKIKKESSRQQRIVEILQSASRQLSELIDLSSFPPAYIQTLMDKGLIQIKPELISLEKVYYPAGRGEKIMPDIIKQLQFGALERVNLRKMFNLKNDNIINQMLGKGWIEIISTEVKPLSVDYRMTAGFLKQLNPEQQRIFDQITRLGEEHKPVLLHGITGSGKTEVYLHLIYYYVSQGKQAILLVPEIALTPQMVYYFSRVFGEGLAVLHSRLAEGERIKEWYKIKKNYAKVIIGSRSALFSPVRDLGIIIMDEEHEWTYKQENNPRYHARKVAEMMAEEAGCQLVLGSATPDVESYHQVKTGQYRLSVLTKRAQKRKTETASLPQVQIVDLRQEFHRRNMSVLSTKLQQKIQEKLSQQEQIILFLNKRGSASAVICRECGFVSKCDQCEVSLTYHKSKFYPAGRLVCHHCGLIKDPPSFCPHCASANIRYIGVGTQRVEEEINKLFPQARILRVDKDTTRGKDDFKHIYQSFSRGEADILVGTQMVTKGFDFPNVTLVGVILAETTLYIPDFRSTEKLFQLLMQVGGRAGRSWKPGEVIIQTYNPDHFVFKHLIQHNYQAFQAEELKNRQSPKYPPFTTIIKLTFSHEDKKYCLEAIQTFHKQLLKIIDRDQLQVKIYTAPALIPHLQGKYHFNLILKGQGGRNLLEATEIPYGFKVDVDPVQVC